MPFEKALARAAPVLMLGIPLLVSGQLASGRPLASASRCPVFPKSNQWNLPVNRLPVAAQLGCARALDRRRRAVTRGLRLGPLGRWSDRHPLHHSVRPSAQGACELRLRRRVRQGPVPDPAAMCRSRAAASPMATATRSSSTAATAASTSSTTSNPGPVAAGTRAQARSGTCARTTCGRGHGHRPMPPACRSSPASPAMPRCAAAPSTTRSASPCRARARRSSIPPGTSPRATPTPTSPPWASASGSRRASTSRTSPGSRASCSGRSRSTGRWWPTTARRGIISGAPNRHWNNDDLHSLSRLRGSDFEAVDTSSLPRR